MRTLLVATAMWLVATPATVDAKPLTIATYNVNFGMPGNAKTMKALESLDADVIFLQESNASWERAIRQRLGRKYRHMSFEKSISGPGSIGVISKLPFRAKTLHSRVGPFPAWLVSLKTGLGRLRVLNVHLDPPIRWARGLGWMAAYAKSQELHQKELRSYLSSAVPSPDLIVGDFNEDAEGKGIRWLKKRGYSSAISKRINTWRWKTKFGEIRWPLDHVMHSKRFKVRSAKVIEKGSSDHYPVVVTLEQP